MGLRRNFIILLLFLIILFSFFNLCISQEIYEEPVSAVYITGIGCSNCAVTDPRLFIETTNVNLDLIIFEYEIYKLSEDNQDTKNEYFKNYLKNDRPGVPFLILNKDKTYIGRFEVMKASEQIININSNAFPKPDGSNVSFKDLDIVNLPGNIKIWTKNRVLLPGKGGDNTVLKKLLLDKDLSM